MAQKRVQQMRIKDNGTYSAEAFSSAAGLVRKIENKTLDQLIDEMAEELDFREMMAEYMPQYPVDGVYYVEDDKIYLATDWDGEFIGYTFALEGDTLTAKGASPVEEGADLVFLRVKES